MPNFKTIKPVLHWLFLCSAIIGLLSCSDEKKLDEVKNNKSVRLITLSPHLAELTASAGALGNLVGVVAYSDFPKQVKDIAHVGDAFKLDYETILALKPDYLLSWKGGTPIAVIEKLKSLGLSVIETEIKTLSDIPKVVLEIAKLSNTIEIAKQNASQFNKKLDLLVKQKHTNYETFIETYFKPLYTVSKDHWISEATSVCGYNNIFTELSQISAPITLESVINKNPQAIINISIEEDKQWQDWQQLNAVKNDLVITISPDIISRPTLRIIDGIIQLCQYRAK